MPETTETPTKVEPGLLEAYLQALPAKVEQVERCWVRAREDFGDVVHLSEMERVCHAIAEESRQRSLPSVSRKAEEIERSLHAFLQSRFAPSDEDWRGVSRLVSELREISAESILLSPSTNPRVLAIDDDPDFLALVGAILTPEGFEVIPASDGPKGLSLAASENPAVILVDVSMPGMDGYQVCRELQGIPKTAYIPVLFVTARDDQQDVARAFTAGAADYLRKPIDSVDFVAKVRAHVSTRREWSQVRWSAGSAPAASLPERRAKSFEAFKSRIIADFKLTDEAIHRVKRTRRLDVYSLSTEVGLDENAFCQYLSKFSRLEFTNEIKPEHLRIGILPSSFCRSNLVIPVIDADQKASYVLSNPFNMELMDVLRDRVIPGSVLQVRMAPPGAIAAILDHGNGAAVSPPPPRPRANVSVIAEELGTALRQEDLESPDPALIRAEIDENSPVVALVNRLLEDAYTMGASDIHIEPGETEVTVRYRVDGNLRVVQKLTPARLILPLVARIKIMSQLDISERRLPQDGRIVFKQFSTSALDFDLRVSTAPVNYGEKVCLRILDKQKSVTPLEKMGFSKTNLARYRKVLATPYGMILHVGPTGSGKSMTLYAALNELRNPEINIQTAEDPIEYTLPGISQMQMKREIGLTFARALRCFLRQDPDIILVGEIRDRETAEISIEAALTGHLLLSTLHTNDAPSTIMRFVEMGIEPYMISASLVAVCGQRLMRRLCADCREPYSPDEATRQIAGMGSEDRGQLFRARGCERCEGSGYRGRVGIHELMVIDEVLRAAIAKKEQSTEALKKLAVERSGMITLYRDAMEKVRDGITSIEEALSVVRADESDSPPGAGAL